MTLHQACLLRLPLLVCYLSISLAQLIYHTHLNINGMVNYLGCSYQSIGIFLLLCVSHLLQKFLNHFTKRKKLCRASRAIVQIVHGQFFNKFKLYFFASSSFAFFFSLTSLEFSLFYSLPISKLFKQSHLFSCDDHHHIHGIYQRSQY